MSLTAINAEMMQKAFISAANNISNKKDYIDELNVFPVPDGDTGTNMTLTIMAAAAEVNSVSEPTIDKLAKAISGGSLRGARGNSGVILSQLFRGFCKDIKGKDELYVYDLTSAFAHAVDTAYKAVMKPKEGTILTVARGMADKATQLLDSEEDIISFLDQVVEYGDKVLAETPEMLPVLKEAGVVDSGGQGLMEVMRGITLAVKGEPVELIGGTTPQVQKRGAGLLEDIPKARPTYAAGSGSDSISTADIKFTYCTEFIVLLDKELSDSQVQDFKDFLLSIGDSIVCVADEELVKVHVHTNHPGQAFERGISYGQLTRCKIDNMREEHSERVLMEQEKQKAAEQEEAFKQIKLERKMSETVNEIQNADTSTPEETPEEPIGEYKPNGVIAVSSGDGISEMFRELGADYIIGGGQTMNPSTEDILSAVKRVNAGDIYIFPNNSNIIMAANQAASIYKEKNLHVIPSKTIPQGIAAIINYDPEGDAESNVSAMTEAMSSVKTGEVTYAIRDTSFEGKTIHKNNIMGIGDKGIENVGEDVTEVTLNLIETMIDDESGLITVYFGQDVTQEDADKLAEKLGEIYPDVDVDVHEGKQPIYYYIISVE